MRPSGKQQGAENTSGISGHLFTLHQRLYHALNLGLRSSGYKERKWHCADIEVQRLVLRSIDAFLEGISAETLQHQHPLVKDSIPDMVKPMEDILQLKNEATLTLASNVVVKMVNVVPNSILQAYVLDLVHPLVSLLPSHQLQVAVQCAAALRLILSNLTSKIEREVWQILKETNTVVHIVNNVHDFPNGTKQIDYFQEMISLLSKILWRWPPSRFCIWNDVKLMEVLEAISIESDFSVKIAVLQLYSALALCGNGAQKLLERGETILCTMEHCMASSNSFSVQMEGFKLAQCLTINESACSKMMKICCEPIVKATINGMGSWSSHSGKIPKDQMSLLMEACRLALITRWEGEHHGYFWKLRVDKVLLNLLIYNFHETDHTQHIIPLEEQIATAQQGLSANFLLVLRPFVWDIVGGLAAHCPEDFNPKIQGNGFCINLLITCACLAFMDSIQNTRQLFQNDIYHVIRNASASRSVLMMIYSPCKYIASQARFVLSEMLRPNGKEYLKYLLDKLNNSRNKFVMSDSLQTVINLMSLACYSVLPQYRMHVIKGQGIKTLVAFIRWCWSSNCHIKKSTVAPHLSNTFCERMCCWHTEDWEGEDSPLLFSLWGLAELMHHSGCLETHPDVFAGLVDCNEAQLVSELQAICHDTSSPGPRWYATYILRYFGFYGFPNKLGTRIGKTLDEEEFSDFKLIPPTGEPLSVHGVILMVRCPSLLPPEELSRRSSAGYFSREDVENCQGIRKEVRLSAHVDRQALLKLLEYGYSGYLQAGVALVNKLKPFARYCNLRCLLQMLCKKHPKWGTPIPSSDLTSALRPAAHHFSDIILEAKVTDQIHWRCSTCPETVPHMHVHKVVLCSSSDYFRALFQSGMQESLSKTIKVPVSLEALEKLVTWFYSDEFPKPISGCLWDNLDVEEKLLELHPYVELCWLCEFWLLGDVHENYTRVVISCLDTARELSIKIIRIAVDFSQWKLAEAAANYMAPSYQRLRYSCEFEALDEELVEMVRAASVRHSQKGGRSTC